MKLLKLFRRCDHADRRGIATYYDRDHKLYLRLVECIACNVVLIEES